MQNPFKFDKFIQDNFSESYFCYTFLGWYYLIQNLGPILTQTDIYFGGKSFPVTDADSSQNSNEYPLQRQTSGHLGRKSLITDTDFTFCCVNFLYGYRRQLGNKLNLSLLRLQGYPPASSAENCTALGQAACSSIKCVFRRTARSHGPRSQIC